MLLITDLDNTLLKSDKSISRYTVDVLRRCHAEGHLLAFASARAENAMTRFLQEIKPDAIISNGGATIKMHGNVIYQKLLSAETVYRIIEMCKLSTEQEGLITVEADDGYYCNYHPIDPDRRNNHIYTDFADFRKPAYKVTSELEKEEWARKIVSECPECFYLNFSGKHWRRFAAVNADKETALRALTRHLGISAEEVVAFGDDINDVGMLKYAGTAVAVSNAISEVKAVADHITDSNDADGVARFIEKRILKTQP